MSPPRIVIVGGPRTGKSTLARELRGQGIPTLCGDPRSLVKEPEQGVEYLPEGLGWSEGSDHVASHWFARKGPWCCEGQVMARALRKWLAKREAAILDWGEYPCDRVIVLLNQHQHAVTLKGQESMAKAVRTVWAEIAHHFDRIADYR